MPRCIHCLLFCLILGLSLSLIGCAGLMKKHGDKEKEKIVVFALPLSGSHAFVGAKIREGAKLAEQEMMGQGIRMRLHFFDTQTNDWVTRLGQLSDEFVVVGGPLNLPSYNLAKKSGLLRKHTFFAFLNNLDGTDEGSLAWRFFPSPQDQVDALLNFASNSLHIRSFGAFYPDDSYSQKMVSLFEKAVQRRNLPLQKAIYNAKLPSSWSHAASALINPIVEGNLSNATPIPQTSFEAVFLPASWKHVDNIITSFMYNGEDRLVLMGTMLWEHSLAGKTFPKTDRYDLVMFPSAWNVSAAGATSKERKQDFWEALGYDFVRFAVNLDLNQRPVSTELVAKANQAKNVMRVLAPIHWDNQGIAHQKMFLYRYTQQGIRRIDAQSFNQMRIQRKERSALRLQAGAEKQTQSEVKETLPPEIPQKAEPIPAPQPQSPVAPISNMPHTSYKLRLPSKASNPTP